jgi:nucleotide-binding universal stress UspA family protein
MTKKKKLSKSHHPGISEGSPILCGTDFSANAQCAADVAAMLSERLQTSMELVHVSGIPKCSATLTELRSEALRLRAHGANIKNVLLVGTAVEEIVKRVKSHSYRLVVVSSLGKQAPARWLLGSVSEATAERATVPTLVVRDSIPFRAWLRGQRPLKVFVAFNFTSTSETALRWVKELQTIAPCEVVVGYVHGPTEGSAGYLPDSQKILERDARARVLELLGETPVTVRVEETNNCRPAVRLAEIAKGQGADLLVVGSHQYHGFDRLWHTSVSRCLLHHAEMSVAVVPRASHQPLSTSLAEPVRKVLVPTDFSEAANHAIRHAFSLLGGRGEVQLVHVLHPRQLPTGEYQHGYLDRGFEAAHAKLIKECVEKLRNLIPPAARSRGDVAGVEVIEHSEIADGIHLAAERFGADVVCLGSHGGSRFSKALLGSVAQKVMAHSKRPLLVVPPPVE